MGKIKVVVDYETRSSVDLKARGRTNYLNSPDADILMMGYQYVGNTNLVNMWFPGDPIPDFCKNPNDFTQYAFNAEFEWAVTNILGKRYGFKPTTFNNYICLMALCGRYGLPQSLEKAGAVLKLEHQKSPVGKHLIKLFCTPALSFGRDKAGTILPTLQPMWLQFIDYCKQDVRAEHELLHALPADHLSETEYKAWVHSCQVNARGIPVDTAAVKQIRRISEAYREAHFELLPELTNNAITKITQTQRIVKYVQQRGITMENCQADTVLKVLERDDLPDDVIMLLEMRSQLGLSSIGKYIRFQDMAYKGRVYDNQRYYGAHTGRFTGNGVQLLNLPRASIRDSFAEQQYKQKLITKEEYDTLLVQAVDTEIARYFDGSIVDDNPVKSARALIRSMIKAPAGYKIAAADYGSIEYVVLEWLAKNQEALDRFEAGHDQYVDQAAFMFNVRPENVTKAQRQSGKVVILGCGYGQGAKRLVITAEKQWGMKLTLEESQFMVKGYRTKHKKVVDMWYKLQEAVIRAIQSPGITFETHRVSFRIVNDKHARKWLAMTIPSGRVMYYFAPFVDKGTNGLVPCHWGFYQTSKQWMPMQLTPGRITENVVQALARDLLIYGMEQIEANVGPVIIWSVYDEVVCEIPDHDADNTLERICENMCKSEEWAKGIPLTADGFVGPRYKKM